MKGDCYVSRNSILRTLGYESYADYLESERWRTIFRREIRLRPDCEACGKRSEVLHHTDYRKDTLLGGRMSSLVALCHDCHHKIEFLDNGKKCSLAKANQRLDELLRAKRGEPPSRKSKSKTKRKKNRKRPKGATNSHGMRIRGGLSPVDTSKDRRQEIPIDEHLRRIRQRLEGRRRREEI